MSRPPAHTHVSCCLLSMHEEIEFGEKVRGGTGQSRSSALQCSTEQSRVCQVYYSLPTAAVCGMCLIFKFNPNKLNIAFVSNNCYTTSSHDTSVTPINIQNVLKQVNRLRWRNSDSDIGTLTISSTIISLALLNNVPSTPEMLSPVSPEVLMPASVNLGSMLQQLLC